MNATIIQAHDKTTRFIMNAEALGDSAIFLAGDFLNKNDAGVAVHGRRSQIEDTLNLVIAKLSHLRVCVQTTDRY